MPQKTSRGTAQKTAKQEWEPISISEYRKHPVPFSSLKGIWKGKVKFSEREINRAKIKTGH